MKKTKLLVINYAGDYKEAYDSLNNGGQENYHAQRYSVNFLGELIKKNILVTTIVCLTEIYYDEILDNGVRAIGMGVDTPDETAVWKKIKEIEPTHIIFTSPFLKLIFKSLFKNFKIILVLADSFQNETLKQKLKANLIKFIFNNKSIEWVGNHNLNSCLSLKKIGINLNKIIPWDWPHYLSPKDFYPKKHPKKNDWNLIFVGYVTQEKGVGDIIQAISELNNLGVNLNINIVGKGDLNTFIKLTESLNVVKQVRFMGLVDNKEIIGLMRDADLVIIPSHHEYPEGLPLTIYEALTSRTPIIASNHPMFSGKLVNKESALIYEAKKVDHLKSAINEMINNSNLYENLSLNSENAWNNLQIPVKYGQLVSAWLENSTKSQAYLSSYSLKNGSYK